MNLKMYLTSAFLMFAVVSVVNGQDDPGPGAVTVYSEDGDNFTLYLNGDRKNPTPSTRVVASNVIEVPVAFRIVFENGSYGEIKKNGIRQGTNCLYSVAKNKKGERVLKMKGCTNEPVESVTSSPAAPSQAQQPVASANTSTPDKLSATFSNGVININDGRTLTVKKVKVNSMTYPQVFMTALQGSKVTISYDNNTEVFSAEPPFKYEVKDFSNNNSYFTLTVDEGGPNKTWKVKLQNTNGYDLKIE